MNTNTQTAVPNDELNMKKQSVRSTIFGWIRFIVLLAFIFFIFRYAIGITIVNGNSMNPTLEDGELLLTSNIFFQNERNDTVIIDNGGYDIVKRIIGLPNETVEIKDGIVLVNGKPLEEDYTVGVSNDMPQVLVEEGTYFVIGDNRTPGESLDSRSEDIGLISEKSIKGEAFFSIQSFSLL